MGSQLESAHATEELLERYARLSLERDELAVKVAELKRELASHLPAEAPPSRRRNALLWLAVALASTITLGVVVASAAILAGFWDPLGNDATPTSLAVPALPPPLVEPSSAEPQPAPAPARAQSPSPPAAAVPRLPETLPPATAQTELEIVAARGDSWLQVRRGSASGPLVYEGTLERGRSVSFTGRRLWLRFAVGDHLDVTLNGKRVTGLPSLAGNAAVRSDRVRVLGVG
jgi:RodZ C-terminal domain